MAAERRASVTWRGDLMTGSGTIDEVGSGAFGPLDVSWPWELTPLTGRAIASFLLGFAVAAGFALWENDIHRLSGPAYAFTALAALELLALAVYSDDVTAAGAGTAAYVAFWVVSLGLGAAGAWLSSSSADRAASGSR